MKWQKQFGLGVLKTIYGFHVLIYPDVQADKKSRNFNDQLEWKLNAQ
jgi:hypothetical protein